MGCDIHAHFEIKVDGEWLHYSQANFNRNYRLFEKMAGVRGEVRNAIVPPKGLPKDISKVTALEVEDWGPDAHTFSWLNADEIKEIYEFHQKQYEDGWRISTDQWHYLYCNGWEYFKEFRGEYQKWVEDIRLIFWFDN